MEISPRHTDRFGSTLTKAFLQAVLLVAAGAVLSVMVNTYRHDGLPWIIDSSPATAAPGMPADALTASIQDAWRMYREGKVLFIDARDPAEYLQGHLPGAVNLPADSPEQDAAFLKGLPPHGRELVVYCSDPGCPLSKKLAARLSGKGVKNLKILAAGWVGWIDAGLPVEGRG